MSHIRLENVSKVFDASPAEANKVLKLLAQGMSSSEVREKTGYSVGLYDINLSIEAGELHCIMGLSGSGKSTLVRHINRLIDPTQGKIWIDTQYSVGVPTYLQDAEQLSKQPNIINVLSLSDKPLQQFRQNNVSMVFQHFGLVPHMTVIQNVAYGLRVRKMAKSERHEIARHWLHEVGLDGIEYSYPDELSGGMQQRVGLARALAVDTPIILMDEAFSALDPLIRAQLQAQLLQLQDRLNKTIVFITHDIDEAAGFGGQISILNGGRLVQTGSIDELRTNPADAYVERFMVAKG
ncbi:ATP-binding cassette domain-containing protein [Psychrobacter lutiphocae]|uniref:ATP-binding cassette domain-containing protein n=1 Tax=Psychrobacter lutiphocae TaxID=540500 RepID=UPI00036F9CBE|nr:ATP-binding cassette domain-containing protein [Psychrobacter lutiphocae]